MLLVSPTSLIGLLRTMELGWRQERMVAEAAEIADAAGTLHGRFSKFLTDFDTVGKRLDSATKAYNSAVGSMEGRLLPQLRKVEEPRRRARQGDRGARADRDPGPEITAPELREGDAPEPPSRAAEGSPARTRASIRGV